MLKDVLLKNLRPSTKEEIQQVLMNCSQRFKVMEAQARFDAVRAKIDAITKGAKTLKQEFEAVIRDKTLPLEDRWQLFKDAPENLSDEDSCYVSFDVLGDVSWYDDFHLERHETLYMVDMVDSIQDKVNYSDDNEYDELVLRMKEPGAIDALKEEILAKNIGKFEYDW